MFPPMSTRRCASSALCTGTALIVAGGRGDGGAVLTTVEVMNTETHQWSTAVDLPEPTHYGSLVQVDDHIYMLGGLDQSYNGKKSVHTCSVSALLQLVCHVRSLSPNVIWIKVADLPVTHSACVSLYCQLLVVGGKDSRAKPTSALHMYNPATNSWQVISHMATPRSSCFAAVLPDNQLMVVGGETDSGKTDKVEIATVMNQ